LKDELTSISALTLTNEAMICEIRERKAAGRPIFERHYSEDTSVRFTYLPVFGSDWPLYNRLYNMYMALHIADAKVSDLVADLAKLEGTSKTETLRRLLRKTLAEKRRDAKRATFRAFATKIATEARKEGILPVTKEEMDDLWGMNELDGG
jgi:hypothetical protein